MSAEFKKNTISIAVVGAGPAGMTAVISALSHAAASGKNVEISLFEKNARVGKKILVTGNGRCNITNKTVNRNYYFGDCCLFDKVYNNLTNSALIDFFENLGLLTKEDFAGRVYPSSNNASSVLDVLLATVDNPAVKLKTKTPVSAIERNGSGFLINGTSYFDKVVICCGGKAAPVQGSDGSSFRLLSSMGIDIVSPFPCLVPLTVRNFTKSLKGIRANGKITLVSKGRELASSSGEIQYTDYGLSGIPCMQVSRFASELLNNDNNAVISAYVDSCPQLSDDELFDFLKKSRDSNISFTGDMLLGGIMPKRLGSYLLSECSINPLKPCSSINDGALKKIADAVKNKKYQISGTRGFDDAQVTGGGVPAEELKDNLELKKIKNMYVCGEAVNIDGDCGGYNLQWAFSSGYTVGIACVSAE